MSPPFSEWKNKSSKKPDLRKQVKNRASDYIGNTREMENSKSVPIGSPVARNEPPVSIGSQTQPSEPLRDKNWITSMALKKAICVGLGGV
jgi:hypothetical protein